MDVAGLFGRLRRSRWLGLMGGLLIGCGLCTRSLLLVEWGRSLRGMRM